MILILIFYQLSVYQMSIDSQTVQSPSLVVIVLTTCHKGLIMMVITMVIMKVIK